MTTPIDLDPAGLEAALTDQQIGEWCAEAQGKCLGVIPQARYVIARALAARSVPEAGKAVDDIVAERQRQISAEGWTTEHDDEHDKGEMARAAACYAYEATRTDHQRSLDDGFAPPMWPWAERWWKPTTCRRDLVKAAALIIAEIERLDRAAKG